jgi:hypothetical protein
MKTATRSKSRQTLSTEKGGSRGFVFSNRLRRLIFPRIMQNQIPVILLGSVMLGALLPCVLAGGVELKPGQPFPDIVLPTLADGKPGAISQFRGKKLILHIFASW